MSPIAVCMYDVMIYKSTEH